MRNILPYLTEKLMLVDYNKQLTIIFVKLKTSSFYCCMQNVKLKTQNPGNMQSDALPRLGGQ